MSHDQLAKTLISTFFADFLSLTLSDTAPRLRPAEAVFLDKEIFTDWPDGDRRELDLLARVPVEQEDLCLLIHVEIESRASAAMKALAALMDPEDWSRAELKVECLRRVQQWGVAGFGKEVLVNWIDTYVQLSGEDALEYRRLLALKKNKEVRQMEQTWLGRAEEQGFKKGQADALERMRRMVLKRIEQRFGVVPEPVEARVRETSIETLAKVIEKLPSLRSAEDLLHHRNGKAKSRA